MLPKHYMKIHGIKSNPGQSVDNASLNSQPSYAAAAAAAAAHVKKLSIPESDVELLNAHILTSIASRKPAPSSIDKRYDDTNGRFVRVRCDEIFTLDSVDWDYFRPIQIEPKCAAHNAKTNEDKKCENAQDAAGTAAGLYFFWKSWKK